MPRVTANLAAGLLLFLAASAAAQSRTPKAIDGNVVEILSGDTLVVGAPQAGSVRQGAVYVLKKSCGSSLARLNRSSED